MHCILHMHIEGVCNATCFVLLIKSHHSTEIVLLILDFCQFMQIYLQLIILNKMKLVLYPLPLYLFISYLFVIVYRTYTFCLLLAFWF